MSTIYPVLLVALMVALPLVATFGDEYVHIKVHVPKDQAPNIAFDAEPVPPHKVIHHFHHHGPPHQRSRGRAPRKPQMSPLLESVILSELDKPLHTKEHADYLNHAKELAKHLSESYAVEKPAPPLPKIKVNTYTVIEEKHRPNSYDYAQQTEENNVETYRVINSWPQSHQHKYHQHQTDEDNDDDDDDADNDEDYHYRPPARYQRPKTSSISPSYHSGGYAEPAPVEEPLDSDVDNRYEPPLYANLQTAQAPVHTLDAPEELSSDTSYPCSTRSSNSKSNAFRPSQQLHTPPGAYEDEVDAYAAPLPVQSQPPQSSPDAAWPSQTGYNIAYAETYNSADNHNAGHVQGIGSSTSRSRSSSSGYRYPGPYL